METVRPPDDVDKHRIRRLKLDRFCGGKGLEKRRQIQCYVHCWPVDEVTLSVDEGTGKLVFIDKRESAMSVSGFVSGSRSKDR